MNIEELITGETLTFREDEKGTIYKDKNHNPPLANLQYSSVMKRRGEL